MQQQSKYTEEQLVHLLQSRSTEAFSYLYDQYSNALYGIILQIAGNDENAADVLQETFIKIWQNFDKYDPQRGKLYTWMLNIARNAAIDFRRSKNQSMQAKIRDIENSVDEISKENYTLNPTDNIGVKELMQKLKPDHRLLIDLAFFKGFTHDEISKHLGIPLGTVKTKIRTSINQLREIFK